MGMDPKLLDPHLYDGWHWSNKPVWALTFNDRLQAAADFWPVTLIVGVVFLFGLSIALRGTWELWASVWLPEKPKKAKTPPASKRIV